MYGTCSANMQDLILNIDNKEILNEVRILGLILITPNVFSDLTYFSSFPIQTDFTSFHRLFNRIDKTKECAHYKIKPQIWIFKFG